MVWVALPTCTAARPGSFWVAKFFMKPKRKEKLLHISVSTTSSTGEWGAAHCHVEFLNNSSSSSSSLGIGLPDGSSQEWFSVTLGAHWTLIMKGKEREYLYQELKYPVQGKGMWRTFQYHWWSSNQIQLMYLSPGEFQNANTSYFYSWGN